jgi:hypothetical protein
MRFEWDAAKRAANIAKHRLDFEAVERFDFASAIVAPAQRNDFEEPRDIAIGFIGVRLHVLVFRWRGDVVRVISLRKANAREIRLYERTTT